jgi:rod shape-determining protein MreC
LQKFHFELWIVMVAIPSRHRSLVLLAAVVLAQVLALAIQIKASATAGGKGNLFRAWTVGVISPFGRAGAWTAGRIRGSWRHYFALSDTAKENDRLKKENEALKLQLIQLKSQAEEADRLAALLHFRKSHENVKMIPARVIGKSAEASSQVIYVDRGQREGLTKDMGVITPEGVVGKVSEVYSHTAQVQLLTDKESGVGAMLADSRIQSPVGGMGEPLLNMKYVASDDQVKVGEQVVTSGMDQIFPKDIPVGTVVQVKPGMPFKQIRVQPAANLERLEEVLILPTLEPLETKSEAEARATATPITRVIQAKKPGIATNSPAEGETVRSKPKNETAVAHKAAPGVQPAQLNQPMKKPAAQEAPKPPATDQRP